jgi:hypothetical protein
LRSTDYAKLVIDAASLESRQNVYYLMPFAERLSFVAQQLRALNLVWALAKIGKIRPQSSVAVVGAGLAGVTAGCALAAYGCRVSVFETAEATMLRQRQTDHRIVHPEINAWPDPEVLTHTTALPMLDWYFNICSDAIKLIDDQRKQIVAACGGRLTFICEHTVRDAHPIRRLQEDLVSIESVPRCEELFHLALIAVGFDADREYLDLSPIDYWMADNLETDSQKTKFDNIVISGCGDGGMIDALRCAYSFDKGDLAIVLAGKISKTTLWPDMVDAEVGYLDTRQHSYQRVVDKILYDPEYADVNSMLDAKLRKKPGFVRLLDKVFATPASSKAAPIHKLMVYYAIERGTIIFKNTQLNRTAKEGIYEIDGVPFGNDKVKFVVRHGADPAVGHFLNQQELAAFKEKQKYLSKYNFSAIPPTDYKAAPPFPAFNPSDQAFVNHRRELAEDALRGINKNDSVHLALNELSYTAFHEGYLRFQPQTLFGVEVNYIDSEQLPVAGTPHVV